MNLAIVGFAFCAFALVFFCLLRIRKAQGKLEKEREYNEDVLRQIDEANRVHHAINGNPDELERVLNKYKRK